MGIKLLTLYRYIGHIKLMYCLTDYNIILVQRERERKAVNIDNSSIGIYLWQTIAFTYLQQYIYMYFVVVMVVMFI